MTENGGFIEIQGTVKKTRNKKELDQMLELAYEGISKIIQSKETHLTSLLFSAVNKTNVMNTLIL